MNPLFNASSLSLTANPGTLPNMAEAMYDWFQNLTFTTLVKTIVNFEVVEIQTTVSFMGVRQPLSPQRLALMPEGQRSWRYEMIHAYPNLNLSVDDIITFDGRPYRVMFKNDYKEYAFIEYLITQDYKP